MQAVEQDATRVSARVSELDVAQQRALRLLAATRGQLARENIVEGVRGALSAGNLPAAVEHVRAYREVVGASGGPEDPEVAEVRRELEGALREIAGGWCSDCDGQTPPDLCPHDIARAALEGK